VWKLWEYERLFVKCGADALSTRFDVENFTASQGLR
jgi:hypothetical protein